MTLDRICANPKDRHIEFLKLGKYVPEGTGFFGAARRIVLRVKIL